MKAIKTKAGTLTFKADFTGYSIESYRDAEMAWADYWSCHSMSDACDSLVIVISRMQARSLQIEMNQQLIDRGEWHMVPAMEPLGILGQPCEVKA